MKIRDEIRGLTWDEKITFFILLPIWWMEHKGWIT